MSSVSDIVITPKGDTMAKVDTSDKPHVLIYVTLSALLKTFCLIQKRKPIGVSCHVVEDADISFLFLFLCKPDSCAPTMIYGLFGKQQGNGFVQFDRKFRLKGDGFAGTNIPALYQSFIMLRMVPEMKKEMQRGNIVQCIERTHGLYNYRAIPQQQNPQDVIPYDIFVGCDVRPLHCSFENCRQVILAEIKTCICHAYQFCGDECYQAFFTTSDHTCKRCSNCDKVPENRRRCGRCNNVWYCNRECQRAHWQSHREICAKLRSQKNKTQI